MKTCIKCNTELLSDSKFCHQCGHKFEVFENPEEEFQIKLQLMKERVSEKQRAVYNAIQEKLPRDSNVEFQNIVEDYFDSISNLLTFQREKFSFVINKLENEMEVAKDLQRSGITIDDIGNWYNKNQADHLEKAKNYPITEYVKLKRSYNEDNKNKLKKMGYKNIYDFVRNERSESKWKEILGWEPSDTLHEYTYNDWGLLDVADMALAFMSPVSAARYVIKKLKDEN